MAYARSLYSPSKGIICDRKDKLCVDSSGISLRFTKIYLGSRAAKKLKKNIDRYDMDLKEWTFSNGVSCNIYKRICKKSKWRDRTDFHWTKILFGRLPHRSHTNRKAPLAFSKACKNYLGDKFPYFPNTAFSVSRGYYLDGVVHVPVNFNWNEARVDEKGECIVKNGIVKRYKTLY